MFSLANSYNKYIEFVNIFQSTDFISGGLQVRMKSKYFKVFNLGLGHKRLLQYFK